MKRYIWIAILILFPVLSLAQFVPPPPTIPDVPVGSVVEADLDALDAPADEECLTYESGAGGDFEWQSCGEVSHATDCTSLSCAAENNAQTCLEEDANTFYVCESATTSWIAIAAGAGESNTLGSPDVGAEVDLINSVSKTGTVLNLVSLEADDFSVTANVVTLDDVALTTDTSGNYVDDVTSGNGITVTHTPAEGSSAAVAVEIKDNAENAVGTTQSVSGLEFESAELTLLQGCADNEILKWDETADDWNCEADSGGAETNDLEAVATSAGDAEVFVGTGLDAGAYITGLAACAADEKIEYVPGSPDTFTCEAIGSLVDADIGDITLSSGTAGDFVQNITAGAGLASSGAASGEDIAHTLSVASEESDFLNDGAAVSLVCGASNQGRMQVMDDGSIEYCDGATTSVLQTGFLDAVAGDLDTQCDDIPCVLNDDTANLEAADNSTLQLATTSFVQQEINGAGGTDLTCSGGQCNVADGAQRKRRGRSREENGPE